MGVRKHKMCTSHTTMYFMGADNPGARCWVNQPRPGGSLLGRGVSDKNVQFTLKSYSLRAVKAFESIRQSPSLRNGQQRV